MPRLAILFAVLASLLLAACSGGSTVYYRYSPSKGGRIVDGLAEVSEGAPDVVKDAIAAGNRIVGLPYRYGGGRGEGVDSGYDCSGMTSYVLREVDLLDGCLTSDGFRKYGRSGRGEWITIYARSGHVFLEIAGLRLDTGWHGAGEGPRWSTKSRSSKNTVLRHPRGL